MAGLFYTYNSTTQHDYMAHISIIFKTRFDIANWLVKKQDELQGTTRVQRAAMASDLFKCEVNDGHLKTIENECGIQFAPLRPATPRDATRELAQALCEFMSRCDYPIPESVRQLAQPRAT